jgi:hypothetical protein
MRADRVSLPAVAGRKPVSRDVRQRRYSKATDTPSRLTRTTMEYLRLRCRAAAGLQSMIVLHLFHRSGTLLSKVISARARDLFLHFELKSM